MKLKVIGWTYYDNTDIEEGYCGWAAINAITDEVIKKGYKFSGEDHQELPCCVPVLSDGKLRRMSQRGWGRLMADAWGYNGMYDYSLFAFGMENCIYPPEEETFYSHRVSSLPELDESGKVEESTPEELVADAEDRFEDISDEYLEEILKIGNPAAEHYKEEKRIFTEEELREKITVPDATVAELAKMLKEGKFVRRDEPLFRYIDKGDLLTLMVDGEEFSFNVTEVNREKDFTPEEDSFIWESRYSFDEKKNEEANKLFETTPQRVIILGEFSKRDSLEPEEEPADEKGDTLKKLIDSIKSRASDNTEEVGKPITEDIIEEEVTAETDGEPITEVTAEEEKDSEPITEATAEVTDGEASVSGMWSESSASDLLRELLGLEPDEDISDYIIDEDTAKGGGEAITPEELIETLERVDREDSGEEANEEANLDDYFDTDALEGELMEMIESINADADPDNPPADAKCDEYISDDDLAYEALTEEQKAKLCEKYLSGGEIDAAEARKELRALGLNGLADLFRDIEDLMVCTSDGESGEDSNSGEDESSDENS